MSSRRNAAAAVALAAVALVAAVVAVSAAGNRRGSAGDGAAALAPSAAAPLVPDLAMAAGWLNSPPLSRAQLSGRVTLVDFWTASCINCRRTFPFLRRLADTYRPAGLVVVGVHAPEFPFEADPGYVTRSVRELEVTWPVAADPQRRIWTAFGNQYWPTTYLVDRHGKVRYAHIGEGEEGQLETASRALLAEGGSAGPARVGPVPSNERPGDAGVITPELYFGADRGTAALAEGRVVPAGLRVTRHDRGAGPGRLELDGQFLGAPDHVTASPGASVALQFTARDLYLLAGSGDPAGGALTVTLDGAPVPAGRRGPDLAVLADGRTTLAVGAQGLRHVLTGPSLVSGRLRLTVTSGEVDLFTTTSGG